MIATVTLNPAVDYTVSIGSPLRRDAVNRTETERMTAGGKGINVSYILHELGADTRIFGFLAGSVGSMISAAVQELSLPASWISLDGQQNRINLKIQETGAVTELNGRGISVSADALDALTAMLECCGTGDTIVLAGRIPAGADSSLYGDIMRRLAGRGIQFAVDAEGDALRGALPQKPFLIKPNLPELAAIAGREITAWQEAIPHGRALQAQGAQNVLISMGRDGALLLTADGAVYRAEVPLGTPVNTVGAGDSMLGGFLAACAQGKSLQEALRFGIAAGSATAYEPWLADNAAILSLLSRIPQPVRF